MSEERVEIAGGKAVLYCGNCLEILPEFETESVSAVVTDPPYGMNYDSGWSGSSVHLDGTRLCLRMYRQVLPDIARIMRNDSHLYWFTRWDVWPDAYDAIAPHVPVKNALIWDKGHPGMGNLEVYGYSFEMIVFASKGHRKLNGGRPSSIFSGNSVPVSQRKHVTEKPIWLIKAFVEKSTDDNETILDPFMGSGTTGVACMQLGRKFIGVEIEPKYFDIAVRRITAAAAQLTMF